MSVERANGMAVVDGIDALESANGPLFVVVGVFDGLHLGHQYLLKHLVAEAAARQARPAVITFDSHPDEVLTGKAPPLLLDPLERLERLEAADVEVAVVQHFDQALRMTPYDAFIGRIASRAQIAGFLMTPDAAFGHERGGTVETVTALGRTTGFEVVVVPPFELDGRPVRSSDVRAAIAQGDLRMAERLLGRRVSVTGTAVSIAADSSRIEFDLPVALPPSGPYEVVFQPDAVGPSSNLSRGDGRYAYIDPDGVLYAPFVFGQQRVRLTFEGSI